MHSLPSGLGIHPHQNMNSPEQWAWGVVWAQEYSTLVDNFPGEIQSPRACYQQVLMAIIHLESVQTVEDRLGFLNQVFNQLCQVGARVSSSRTCCGCFHRDRGRGVAWPPWGGPQEPFVSMCDLPEGKMQSWFPACVLTTLISRLTLEYFLLRVLNQPRHKKQA